MELLGILGKLVQRLNAIREPVSGDEVLRVVQRRLFSDLGDEIQRREVASAYADSYRGFALAGGISAQIAQQQAEQLRERILLSYPFHPALLDLMRERRSAQCRCIADPGESTLAGVSPRNAHCYNCPAVQLWWQ